MDRAQSMCGPEQGSGQKKIGYIWLYFEIVFSCFIIGYQPCEDTDRSDAPEDELG